MSAHVISFDRGTAKVTCALCGMQRQPDECAGMVGHYRCIICIEESRMVGTFDEVENLLIANAFRAVSQ